MVDDYRVVKSEKAFQGKIFKIFVDEVRMPNGRVVEREVLSHMGAVGVVPLTAEGEVILVSQYRHAARSRLWEIPAGKLDREEAPAACAQRELREETGAVAEKIIKLTEFYNSPGYSDERFYLFLAPVTRVGVAAPDGDEEHDMTVKKIPLAQALELVKKGEICDAKSIIGLLWAQLWG